MDRRFMFMRKLLTPGGVDFIDDLSLDINLKTSFTFNTRSHHFNKTMCIK